jgi:hypothetical protein
MSQLLQLNEAKQTHIVMKHTRPSKNKVRNDKPILSCGASGY